MPVKVIVNANFRRQIAAFRDTGKVISVKSMPGFVGSSALAAQKLARVYMKDLVYTAELPKSAYFFYPKDPEKYLEKRRVGRVFNAIKVEPPKLVKDTWTAAVKVDKRDFPTYYYALILNYGGKRINYAPRPFWTKMKVVMVARYKALGAQHLKGMKGQLLGKATLK